MVYNFTIKYLEQGVFLDCMEAGLEAFQKNALYLNVNVFSTKALIKKYWGHYFYVSYR